ncbi:MAG: undecaprenyl-diphosphatase UppP [Bacteroidota bacterium]
MTTFQAFLMGIVQGLTEFLPVSSTAHLLVTQSLLRIPATDDTFAFAVLIQLGTLLSLFIFFWRDFLKILLAMLKGLRGRKPFEAADARLGWFVALGSIPALAVGFLLRNVIKDLFHEPLLEAGIRLLVTSLLLVAAELIARGSRHPDGMTWMDSLVVGIFQVLAIFPGASRSGSSITGGMIRGFSRPEATRFAFLLSAPLMLVAGAYQARAVIILPGTHKMLPLLFVGFVTAAVVGWLALLWFVRYVNRHSLYAFASYTGVVGLACLAAFFLLP